jgi:hypothetical protein
MKYLGYLFSVGGLVALVVTGINYINNSESFSAFGLDIAVSQGDPVPMIISAIVMVAGVLIVKASEK